MVGSTDSIEDPFCSEEGIEEGGAETDTLGDAGMRDFLRPAWSVRGKKRTSPVINAALKAMTHFRMRASLRLWGQNKHCAGSFNSIIEK